MIDLGMTRDEHLAWAKRRALEYLDEWGDVQRAVTSIMTDLTKHPELAREAAQMGPLAMVTMISGNVREARRFIEGFQ
ncbi:MAG: hypothetical protein J2P55_03760 [Rhizobiales bacterium]|nr:hypothetical protein [Hyphomicrobiales bacterium]